MNISEQKDWNLQHIAVGWPWLDARCPPSRSSAGRERRRGQNKMEKLMGNDKSSLTK